MRALLVTKVKAFIDLGPNHSDSIFFLTSFPQ